MPAPTPVNETYIPCVSLAATLGGVAVAITAGGFSIKTNTDDMTNNLAGGDYEDVKTTRMASFKMTIAAKNALTGLVPGDIYLLLINTTAAGTITGGVMAAPTPTVATAPAFAGSVRVMLDDAPILDVTKGVKYSFTGNSQGAFAVVL